MESDELGKVLRQLGLKKKRLVNLLPLLEFITWSLLEEDSTVRNQRDLVKKKKRRDKLKTQKDPQKQAVVICYVVIKQLYSMRNTLNMRAKNQ